MVHAVELVGDIFRYLMVHAVELVGDVAGDHGGHHGGQVGLLDKQVLDGGAVPEDVATLAGRDDAHLRTTRDDQPGRNAGVSSASVRGLSATTPFGESHGEGVRSDGEGTVTSGEYQPRNAQIIIE